MKRLLSIPKSILIALFRYPQITIFVGVALLVLLVWVAGPLVGIGKSETRLFLIVGILFLWILFLLIDRIRTNKNSQLLEESLQKQAREQVINARPDRKEEIEALKVQFEKAVASLKQSKMGKSRGKTALYTLPWYMIIGPPGSGKSTALLHSGLQFPFQGELGKGIQGIGGTRNCDWWFTNDAVLLDTAGRYVTEEEDREEWIGFLDLLSQYRKKKPINGILVAISIADLLQAGEEDLEWHAKNIRNRIDELIGRLGIVFPVYLIFTKCDLLRGFVEFFEDLSRSNREQIWGSTLRKNSASNSPYHAIFDSEFRQLSFALHAWRTTRLTSARGSQKIKDIFGFPLQFASCRERLTRFVELLFQPNPYRENPIFRGFYFTSGTQEGTPIDRILSAVSRASGLPGVISDVFAEKKETKSYFIKNLFTEIIFPDQLLVGHTSRVERQRSYMKVAIFAGSILFSVIFIAGLFFSFVGNKYINSAVRSVSIMTVQMNVQDQRQFAKNIGLLDRLRSRLEEFQIHEKEGAPLRLKWGLYRGNEFIDHLRRLYFERFNALFLIPTKVIMEEELREFVSDPDNLSKNRGSDYYSILKAYLMMSDPSNKDPVFLEKRLQEIWDDHLIKHFGDKEKSEELHDAVSRHIIFYSRYPDKEGAPIITPNPPLVKSVRQALINIPMVDRVYAGIKQEALKDHEPYTLEVALHGRHQDVLVGEHQIPGFFTQEVWRRSFKDSLGKVLEGWNEEGWVLGVPEKRREEIEVEVERLYFNEYVYQWKKFLESTRIRPAGSLSDISKIMEILTQDNSPLTELLSEVVKNTNLEQAQASQIPGVPSSGLVDKMKRGLGLNQRQEDGAPPTYSNPVSIHFRSIHEFILPSKEKKGDAPMVQYRAELAKAYDGVRILAQQGGAGQDPLAIAKAIANGGSNDMLQATRNAERVLQQLDPENRRVIAPLLLQPFKMTISAVMNNAQEDLNKRWRSEVYEVCVKGIGGRYPFLKDGEDAALSDVADFFHPQNGIIWKFYERELNAFVEEGNDRWEAKKGMEGGISFSPEFLENLRRTKFISESLFPRGNPDPKLSFDLYPYPTPGASEILLQVDGKDLRYRNEPQEWYEFTWPGPSGTSGVSLQASTGVARQVRKYTGRWGFFRLLDAGRVTAMSGNRYHVEWDLGLQETRALKIRYDLRAQSFKNPFRPGIFADFQCQPKIG